MVWVFARTENEGMKRREEETVTNRSHGNKLANIDYESISLFLGFFSNILSSFCLSRLSKVKFSTVSLPFGFRFPVTIIYSFALELQALAKPLYWSIKPRREHSHLRRGTEENPAIRKVCTDKRLRKSVEKE